MALGLVVLMAAAVQGSSSAATPVLEPLAFERLPVGSIRATGWLKDQLQIAADGYTGHLCDWYDLCANSTWLGGAQEAPNPEVFAYWLNGAAPLAHQIDNAHLSSVVSRVVDYVLANAQPDGLLGAPLIEQPQCTVHHGNKTCKPPRFGNGTLYWAKTLVVFALQAHAEASPDDARTIPALERHFAAITKHLKTTPPAMWGASRWVESALGMQWMLDRGLGGPELLEALHSLRDQSTALYDWPARFLLKGGPWNDQEPNGTEKELHHGVNLAEAIKVGAVWYRVSRDKKDLENTQVALEHLTSIAGSPSGAFFADEIYTPPNTPARGTETCNVVETMFSMEMAFSISGQLSYADRLERLAYNALPAALWPDITANVYLQQTNMIMAKDTNTRFPHDGPKSTIYGLHRCCTSNFNQGWPKYTQTIVQRTPKDNGLALVVFAPANVTAASVGGEKGAQLTITTNYPFDDRVQVRVKSDTAFPLHLRIPGWVASAEITLDGAQQPAAAIIPGEFYTLPAVGGGGGSYPDKESVVVVTFKNEIRVEQGYNDSSVSVHRGALLFAMDIGNQVQAVNSSNGGSPEGMTIYTEYEVTANKPWNMAIAIGRATSADPETEAGADNSSSSSSSSSSSALQFVPMAAGTQLPKQPFDPATAPVHIKARGRQLPEWQMLNNSASMPPQSPVKSTEPWAELILLPFGSTNIRMAQLPTLAPEKPL